MKEKRHKKIIEKLNLYGIINIEDISKEFNVAKMTVRRDLKELEEAGKLVRVHGGAKKKEEAHLENERLYLERMRTNPENKDYAAKIAAGIIENNDIVYIGPGTTTERILLFLEDKKVTIVTNSLSVITKYYSNSNFKMLILGGIVRNDSEAIIPDYFLESIEKINVNKCFIGTNGINESKITTSNFSEGLVEKVLFKNSQQRYIITDSSKFNKEAMFSFLNSTMITGVITDNCLNRSILNKYRKIYNIINE